MALKVAAITKLSRNLLLAGVLPYLAIATARDTAIVNENQGKDERGGAVRSGLPTLDEIQKHVPLFVVGFVGMALFRSAGDASLELLGAAFGVVPAAVWTDSINVVGNSVGSNLCLGTAMAAVGLNTSVSTLKGIGPRPFALGLGGGILVGSAGLCAALAFPHLQAFL